MNDFDRFPMVLAVQQLDFFVDLFLSLMLLGQKDFRVGLTRSDTGLGYYSTGLDRIVYGAFFYIKEESEILD